MGEDRAFEAKKSRQRPWGWRELAKRLRWPKSTVTAEVSGDQTTPGLSNDGTTLVFVH